jgi:RimJ/RimL family protein N-acetyltransferase
MVIANSLHTNDPNIVLVEPDIERDAALGVRWFERESGRATLTAMGVPDKDNHPTTLDEERERVKAFIENNDQLNWMIKYRDEVVGSVWADLKPVGTVPAPAIHIMIGDPSARGKGVGFAASSKVIEHLVDQGFGTVYSRHLAKNSGASGLLHSLGFTNLGETYSDEDGLEWQNLIRRNNAH